MTIDLRTASVDEMRDWLAKAIGWRFIMDREIGPVGWQDPQGYATSEQPFTTLDAIAAVWRTELVGWWWGREEDRDVRWWYALPPDWDGAEYQVVNDTGDELADRLRLTCLALAAERGIK